MKNRKLYAIAPDGTAVTRRTHRDYAYAVLVLDPVDGWGTWSFNGRLDLAVREAQKARQHYRNVAVVPVRESEAEAREAVAQR